MRMPKRGEKGFTLIELLIVVAILGVLAAVIIPNVGRFLGRGEEEARRTEYHNMSSAVIALMTDNDLTEIPNAIVYAGTATNAVNTMVYAPGATPPATATGFPDPKTLKTAKDAKDGVTGVYTQDGYTLYGHEIAYDSTVPPDGVVDAVKLVNYITMDRTKYYYTCEKDGTVRQWASADTTASGTEYKY